MLPHSEKGLQCKFWWDFLQFSPKSQNMHVRDSKLSTGVCERIYVVSVRPALSSLTLIF